MDGSDMEGAAGPIKLSVVIVSYGVRELLGRCLESLRSGRGDLPCEVVVVDNASPDGSADMVRAQFPEFILHAHRDNLGFSQAVNRGVACSNGEAILLLNPDTEVGPGALSRMMSALERRSERCALGFRQVDADGRFQLSFGPRPSLRAELIRRTVQRRLDRGGEATARVLDFMLRRAHSLAWVSGASLLVRRTAFEAVGGFDEGYFLYFEDIDFCLRLRESGGEVVYEPSVTIVHHRGASAREYPERARRAYRESQRRFWARHGTSWQRFWVEAYLALRGEGS